MIMHPLITPVRHVLGVVMAVILLAPDALFGTTFVVTNTASSGPGSLNQAIASANSSPGADLITFNIPGTGVQTITGSLPTISDTVILDGSTQPTYAGQPLINVSSYLKVTASQCQFLDLAIGSNSAAKALEFNTGGSNVVSGCYIGTGPYGTNNLNLTTAGIYLYNSAGNQIGGTTAAARNLIWAGTNANVFAIYLLGSGCSNNVIQGNYIGVDSTGTNPLPWRVYDGIEVACAGNLIGGVAPGAGNVIVKTTSSGIDLNSGSIGNVIQGNYIGVDATGTRGLGNSGRGIAINYGGISNSILNNLISSNRTDAIYISGNYTPPTGGGNIIQGNYMGTDVTGLHAIPNGIAGIFISGSYQDLVGGTNASARNLISGNTGTGITLSGNTGTIIQGNWIGVDATGVNALGNSNNGMFVNAQNVRIGGAGGRVT